MLRHSPPQSDDSTLLDDEDTTPPLLKIAQNAICTWFFIDDDLGSFLSCYKYGNCGSIELNIINVFSGEDKIQLFTAMHPDAALTIQSLDDGD